MVNRLRELSDEVRALESKLREAGGAKKLEKLHEQGKLSARERVELLRDKGSSMLEVGLLVAYDQYEGQAPAAGVVTAVIRVQAARPSSLPMTRRSKPARGGPRRSRRFSGPRRSRCGAASRSCISSIRPA